MSEQLDQTQPPLAERLGADSPSADLYSDSALESTPRSALERVRYFGDYELIEEIARGGMGIVHRARQVSLNRYVALKMIRAGTLASPAEIQRFRTEAEAAANLDHPHIVPIYEVGEHQGQHYFSMRLIDGKDLARAMKASKFSPAQSAQIMATVSRAIHSAHQHGILHRDLKPSNILLDSKGEPHVTDFGLARLVEKDSSLTQSVAVMGTPSYMAPEQAAGQARQVSTAADIYSLGAILYELLTGHPPFQGATPVDTLRRVMEDEPRGPRAFNPKVPADLETICLKCLQKNPQQRYASAEAVATDLERWERGEPIEARPVDLLERTLKWARRRPATAALAVSVGITILALVVAAVGVRYNFKLKLAYETARQAQAAEAKQRERADTALQAEAKQRERAEQQSQRASRNFYLASIAWADLDCRNKSFDHADRILNETPGHLRNWEWYYLKRLCRSEVRVLRGDSTNLLAIAFLGDTTKLASISEEGVLTRWNIDTGLREAAIPVWTNGRHLVAFSRDGSRLLRCGWQEEPLRVWDVKLGMEVFSVDLGSSSDATAIAISPNGEFVAVATHDKDTIRVWNVNTRQLVRTLGAPAKVMAFSPNNERLISCSADAKAYPGVPNLWNLKSGADPGVLNLWNLESGAVTTLDGHTAGLLVDFSPDGQRIAGANTQGSVRIWSAQTGQLLHTFEAAEDAGSSKRSDALPMLRDYAGGIAFTYDSKRLALCTDTIVKILEIESGITRHILRAHWTRRTVAFNGDASRLVSATSDGSILVRELANKPEALNITGVSRGLAFSPNGRLLTSGSAVWSAVSGASVVAARAARFGRPAFSPDGLLVAGGLGLMEAQTGKDRTPGWTEEAKSGFSDRSPYGVSWSLDGSKLAAGKGDYGPGIIKILDVRTGTEIQILKGHTNPVWDVAFSLKGRFLASASGAWRSYLTTGGPGEARLWDLATGQAIQVHRTRLCLYSIFFSGNGERFAASGGIYNVGNKASDRGEIRVWDTQNAQEIFSASGLPSCVYSVAMSPDGKRLVAAVGEFGETGPFDVKLWDVESGREILTLGRHDRPVQAVAFSPDGKRIASAGQDQKIKIWSIE